MEQKHGKNGIVTQQNVGTATLTYEIMTRDLLQRHEEREGGGKEPGDTDEVRSGMYW